MNGRAILLSVAPEFAEKIAGGSKTVELRRRFPDAPEGTWIYLYVTLPVGAILGRVRVASIDVDKPTELWARHRAKVGLSRDRFDHYFQDQDAGFAVQLSHYESIEPIRLEHLRIAMSGFVAPQSYRYLDIEQQKAILSNRHRIRVEEKLKSEPVCA
ncbi:MAG: ASCH domain-containing protein [Gammaproteobacteria bacterium]|nr:ASCH domain-containing protein [Gammaproteobacteria bacterium]MCP5135377.1 ASCH domain-containing protein [Gammaproteobacteria bacterium]